MIIGKAISPFALRKKNGGGSGGTDADAQAFITGTGISGTNATATNQLVLDLKEEIKQCLYDQTYRLTGKFIDDIYKLEEEIKKRIDEYMKDYK